MDQYRDAINLGKILAVAGVLLIHLFYGLPSLYPYKDYTQLGANGVAVFFVISGFTIMHSIERSESIKQFFVKRALRILPLYYFLLLADIVIRLLGVLPMLSEDMYHIGYLRYVLFMNTVIPSNDLNTWNNLHHTWTLSCFVFFYLLAPFLYRCCSKWYRAFGLWGICWIISKGIPIICQRLVPSAYEKYSFFEQFLDWTPICNLYVFLYGVLLFFAIKQGWTIRLEILMAMEVVLLFILGKYRGFLFWGAAAVLFLLLMGRVKIRSSVVKNIFAGLGAGSFSIYLTHGLVMDMFEGVYDNGIVILIVILFVGFLVYELVENWLTGLLKRFGQMC